MTRGTGPVLRMSYLVASIAGVAFFVMSVALLGFWPKRVIEEQTRLMSPEHPLDLTLSEQRGRAVYSREGCAYCHSQQVRYVHADMQRFGRPTLAWETRLDYPHLWGTRRIGPDLSRVGGTHSDDWHFAHLYSPRAIVAASVMPAYPSLFEGAAERPRQEARDLVAYLNSLGHARELAGPEGDAHARQACNCPDDEMREMAFMGPLNAHTGRPRRTGEVPALPASADRARGEQLYADHCASCHGVGGKADGPGAAMLDPRPKDLTEVEYSQDRVAEVLWNGVDGTSMPAWRDRSIADLSAIAQVVRGLHVPPPDTPLPDHLDELGARVYTDNCIQCHGETGAGDGPATAKLGMAPTDFRRQRLNLAAGVRVLREGVHGTPMAPWTDRLDDAERLAAAHHVRGFYAGDHPR